MESIDMYLIRIRTDKGQQTAAHRNSAGIRIGQTEDIFGRYIRFQEYLPYPGRQDLCFARTGSGNDHHGSLRCIHRQPLLLIQLPIFFLEM